MKETSEPNNINANVLFKQEDSSSDHKLNLLKQLKITLESLMFGNGFANTIHKYNAINVIFCKNIMSILEDGFYIDNSAIIKNQSFISSSSSPESSSSPLDNQALNNLATSSASTSASSTSNSNSRKTTQTSLNNKNESTQQQHPLLWLFITYVLTDSLNLISTQNFSNNNRSEYIAKKDFRNICNQITQQQENYDTDSNSSNIILEWISSSLRQHCLLNQLIYLLNDEFILRKFYGSNSFVLDRSFVDDFLLFIKSYEQNDVKIINKVKRNFFVNSQQSIDLNEPSSISPSKTFKKRHFKQNSADLTAIMKFQQQQQSNLVAFGSIDLFNSNNQKIISTYSSINDLNIENGNETESIDSSLLADSIIELKINELNQQAAAKQNTNKHRRMHSFPSIQINAIKKSTMLNNQSLLTNPQHDNLANNESNDNRSASILKTTLNTDNDILKIEKEEKSVLNSFFLKDESSFIENCFECKNDLLEKTTIFDFIHAVQLQSECSTLDKENAHFIMADLAIVSNELIKTNELFDDIYLDHNFVSDQVMSTKLNKSNSIKIKLNDKSFSSMNDSFNENNSINNRPCSLSSTVIQNNSSPNNQVLFIIDENKSIHSNDANNDEDENDEFLSRKVKRENWLKTYNQNRLINESIEESANTTSNNESKILFELMDSTEKQNTSSLVQPKQEDQAKTENNSQINLTEDGFEVINSKESTKNKNKLNSQDTIRSRRYSWEEVNDAETAENLANVLIKHSLNSNFEKLKSKLSYLIANNYEKILKSNNSYYNFRMLKLLDRLKKKKQTIYSYLVPKLNMYEFLIQYLEYMEFMQVFNELKNSGKLQAKMRTLNNQNSNSKNSGNLSASTMFLSHSMTVSSISSVNKSTSPSKSSSSSLFGSIKNSIQNFHSDFLTNKKNNSVTSASKIKSAALAAALTISLLQQSEDLEKSSNNNHSSSFDNYDIISTNSKTSTLPINILKQEKTNSLIRQLSYNIQDSLASSSYGTINNDLLLSTSSSQCNSSSQPNNTQSLTQSLVLNSYKNLNSRIIGDEIWAPVREQLILNKTLKPNRLDQIKVQHFRCADCGIQVRQDKIRTFYYCEYFSKYFCRCCHIKSKSYIPAYVINSLDFRNTYEVSKKAKNFLEKIYNEPLITLESLNPSLFNGDTIFVRVKNLRYQLHNSRSYINSCRLAVDLKEKLYSQFDDFFINDQHVYSIEILFKIKKTNFFEQLKLTVRSIIEHIKSCEICSQLGHICGICSKNKELLYPFDFEKVEKCPNCLACYHKYCLKLPEQCPRCERKRNRKISSSNNSKNGCQSNDSISSINNQQLQAS